MMYLGTPGRMVAIKCPTTQRVNHAGRYSFNTTLGGVVKAQAGPPDRRTWDIGLGKLSTPSDVGVLMDFVTGGWGPGPFWFVPTDAPVVNVLTPDAATCAPEKLTLRGGAQLLGSPPMPLDDDGHAARSLWKNAGGSVGIGGPVPVVPGRPVTGSAWVVGSGAVQLMFVDASGIELSTVESQASWSTPNRVAASTMAPSNASGVQLVVTGSITQVARPAITWTPTVLEWGDGQGCDKAIVQNMSRDVVKAWENPNTGRWSEVNFTVREVG